LLSIGIYIGSIHIMNCPDEISGVVSANTHVTGDSMQKFDRDTR